MQDRKIKPINPFGPKVGQFRPGADVAATFARIRREQARQQPKPADRAPA